MANHTKELVDDSQFDSKGVFAELTHQVSKQDKLISGLRVDQWKVDDKRGAYSATTSGMTTTYTGSDTSGQNRKEATKSIFGRYEHAHNSNVTSYAGLGYAERFPDYWELIAMSRDNQAHSSLQTLKKERVTQLDIGSLYKNASISAFYNQIDDFILINYNSNSMMRRNLNGISSNIDARTYGLESNISYLLSHHWKASGSVAYVRGEDRTNNAALPQLPPLEGRLGLNYDDTKWSYGALLRLATSQNRYRVGYGNIAGQDLAGNGGFGVFSLNAGYKANKKVKVAFGIDNLFDKTYAEFVSRTGSPSMGAPAINPATTRVNEPGRTAWLKATIALD
jgi:iron complex outermembrane receptor protein